MSSATGVNSESSGPEASTTIQYDSNGNEQESAGSQRQQTTAKDGRPKPNRLKRSYAGDHVDASGLRLLQYSAEISLNTVMPFIDERYRKKTFEERMLVKAIEMCHKRRPEDRADIFAIVRHLRAAVQHNKHKDRIESTSGHRYN